MPRPHGHQHAAPPPGELQPPAAALVPARDAAGAAAEAAAAVHLAAAGGVQLGAGAARAARPRPGDPVVPRARGGAGGQAGQGATL